MSSIIIEKAYRTHALYTLDKRAMLYFQDGLRTSIRRAIWVSKNAGKMKTIALSGQMTTLHPHGDASEVVQNFTSCFKNNQPYFDGNDAGFGTLIDPDNYSAPRYSSLKQADFTKDVILVDTHIVPMTNNYDDTCQEPLYLLPLIPLHFINPITGMAIGYKCSTLPYKLSDIISTQLLCLDNQPLNSLVPYFEPLQQTGVLHNTTAKNNNTWTFTGTVNQISKYKWQITKLPYGVVHDKFIKHMHALYEDGFITNIEDSSSAAINCTITLSKTFAENLKIEVLLKKLKLTCIQSECLYFIDIETKTVQQYTVLELIQKFTIWRLGFFKIRIEYRNKELFLKKSFDEALLKAIEYIDSTKYNITLATRQQFKTDLMSCGIVEHIDTIINLPIYRFNKDEADKLKEQIKKTEQQITYNIKIINSDKMLRDLYRKELMVVLDKYGK